MFSTNPQPTKTSSHAGPAAAKPPRRDRRDYQRQLMRERRAAARDLKLPPIVDPERRLYLEQHPAEALRTYWPHVYKNPFVPSQLDMIEAVARCMRDGTSHAIAAPRGNGKTTIAEGMTILGAAYGWSTFTGLIPATKQMAQNTQDNLRAMLEAESFGADFPEVWYPIAQLGGEPRAAPKQTVDGKPTRINWTKQFLRLPEIAGSLASGAIIYPLSIDSAIRGLKMGTRRPQFILLDDPETSESARSEFQIGVRENILDRDIAGLVGDDMRMGILALVTIQSAISLAAKLTDRTLRPDFGGVRRSAIMRWPDRRDLWDEYIARRRSGMEAGDDYARDAARFYVEHRQLMDAGAVIDNPYRFNSKPAPDGQPIQISSLQACFDFIADKGIDAFFSEYQNDPRIDRAEDAEKLTPRIIESRLAPTERSVLPPHCVGVTAGIDLGKYACHWVVIAWGPEGRGTIIEYGIQEVHGLQTDSSNAAIERAIMAALGEWRDMMAAKRFVDEDGGNEQRVGTAFVDSGTWTDSVYAFVAKHQVDGLLMLASKGYGDGQAARIAPRPGKATVQHGEHWFRVANREYGIWLHHLDANFWRRWVHERFATNPWITGALEQSPHSLVLHSTSVSRQHQTFAKHILAEEYRETFVPGRGMVRKFVAVSHNNHWLDATYMASAAGCARRYFTATALSVSHLEPAGVRPEQAAAESRPAPSRPSRPAFGRSFQHPHGRPFVARR